MEMPLEFLILGSLEVIAGGRRIELGGVRHQIVLALLLLNPGQFVINGRLTEALYGNSPPPTSRAQVQICISALRRQFTAHGLPNIISTRSQGYTIHVDVDQLDATRFETLLGQARHARDTGMADDAIARYREALTLWRGPALDGIDSGLVQSAASRLDERRIMANEDCVQLELDRGRHHDLISELTGLVEAYPLRERLRAQLMMALYRSGRQAEALQVYQAGRRTMIDELGIEPNEQLRRLEHAILTSDASLNPPSQPIRVVEPAASSVPDMLPAAIADFTGRAEQLEAIRRHLARAGDGSSLAVPIVAIVGKAGIGKTTIAVHAARSVADRFPDGQLFADLHGGARHPARPMHVLERFLRVLGVPGAAMPDGLEERAETHRALLANRRMLLVLDDAASESQILPLLPGNPTCAVIVTSRSRLSGLAGAIHVDVDVFDPGQSTELLARIAGAERVPPDDGAAMALAEFCGHLPLALRIAGARLAARPHWSVEQLVGRLEDETRRLDELQHGDMGVRASISLTYDNTDEDARRLFRRLAILDSQFYSAWSGAALLDKPVEVAQDLMDDLADAQLVEITGTGRGVHTQYRLHDLIRVFARERLVVEEPTAERHAALARALGALLFIAEAARRREYGDYVPVRSAARRWPLPAKLVEQLVAAPLAWFERERMTFVSAVRQAAQAGLVEHCWDLAISWVPLFEARVYLDDWRETHQAALDATRQAGDRRGQAAMLYSMGSLHVTEQRFDDARRYFEAALELFQEVADDQGAALTIRHIGLLDRLCGRFTDAAARYEQALAKFRDSGDLVMMAYVLHNLAQLKIDLDDLPSAGDLLSEALLLTRKVGSRRVEAQVLHRLGHTYLQLDRLSAAEEVFDQAVAIVRQTGDPIGEAFALHGLGLLRTRQGEHEEAGRALRHALTLAGQSGARLAEAQILFALGELALAGCDAQQAVTHLEQAASLFVGMRIPLHGTLAYMSLSEAHQAAGNPAAARDALTGALALAEQIDPPVGDRIRAQLGVRLLDLRMTRLTSHQECDPKYVE
jgi:DNA-binding SARP family transcriptional activator/uncharacterized protein HemY